MLEVKFSEALANADMINVTSLKVRKPLQIYNND